VVSLLAEDTVVTPVQVGAVFTQAGLDSYMYTPDSVKGFATLREMAQSGKRLLYFDDGSPLLPWQLPMWTYITDTNYNITDPSQFSCAFYRGQPQNPIYFLNQFIYMDHGGGIVAADPTKAAIANDPVEAYTRAVGCWHQMGRIPNVVYVDFFKEGNVRQVVDELNALPR
jgi:hypothetical protein